METSNKNSKQGLGLSHRNKKSFAAQEMLVLLAELAYNLLSWFRACLSQHSTRFAQYGMLRLVRDVLAMDGKLQFDPQGKLRKIRLNRDHSLAVSFLDACSPALVSNDWRLILGKI